MYIIAFSVSVYSRWNCQWRIFLTRHITKRNIRHSRQPVAFAGWHGQCVVRIKTNVIKQLYISVNIRHNFNCVACLALTSFSPSSFASSKSSAKRISCLALSRTFVVRQTHDEDGDFTIWNDSSLMNIYSPVAGCIMKQPFKIHNLCFYVSI